MSRPKRSPIGDGVNGRDQQYKPCTIAQLMRGVGREPPLFYTFQAPQALQAQHALPAAASSTGPAADNSDDIFDGIDANIFEGLTDINGALSPSSSSSLRIEMNTDTEGTPPLPRLLPQSPPPPPPPPPTLPPPNQDSLLVGLIYQHEHLHRVREMSQRYLPES